MTPPDDPPPDDPPPDDPPLADTPLADAPLADALRERVRVDDDWSYAGFLRRAAAAGVDSCLILFGVGLVLMMLGRAAATGPVDAVLMVGVMAALVGVPLVVVALVVVALPSMLLDSLGTPTTLGKRSFDLVVTDLDGQPVGWGNSLARMAARFGLLIVSLVIVGLIVGLIVLIRGQSQADVIVAAALFVLSHGVPLVTTRRQALHDFMSGTLVLHRPLTRRPSPVADDVA